ncbi:unnamed protein product [Parascedosporium putredinis]|uniref:MATE efflux family protein n=1 Tax=Parascedosporium putredinis TaxID=1442378 RepID=A0A9P1M706_9PEZI|nr:unnamed protein product [Parascedosporium putredinis]CAI7987686.1 unnamed protein product [Parascedosporium putredinis]
MGPNDHLAVEGDRNSFVNALSSSLRSRAPIAEVEEAIARDVADCSSEDERAIDSGSEDSGEVSGPPMYRRPSGVAYGPVRPAFNDSSVDAPVLTRSEREQARNAERALLQDNHLLPSTAGHAKPKSWWRVLAGSPSERKQEGRDGAAHGAQDGHSGPRETSPLLPGSREVLYDDDELEQQWNEAVSAGRIQTTWTREALTLGSYAPPLLVASLFQYSINVVCIFAVGRIGKVELGAVSLASMTSVITGYAPFLGMATSLDTLCAQAYGSGHKHLVGLQFQRMTCLLMLCYIPVAFVWWHGEWLLSKVVPEARSAELAGQYLRVLIIGGPFIGIFEAGKRFVQAQGLFRAVTWVLVIAAPINAFLTWFLVWKMEFGFIGAPMSVVITEILMPLFLFLYRALTNWGPMVRLAIPGMIMIEAEYLAFEILVLASSQFGSSSLAAQSILSTLISISYQLPFSFSIAASTRIANLVGAGLVDAAKVSARVTACIGFILGFFNFVILMAFSGPIVGFFTKDSDVQEIAVATIPIVAVMQICDGVSINAHGILRGIGQQHIGGYANLGGHYLLAMPLSFGTAFGLDWQLKGLWFGILSGILL